MKWFKHYCNCKNDAFIQELIEEFGFQGYGRYWRLLEMVGDAMQSENNYEPVLEITQRELKTILSLKQNKLSSFLVYLENKLKINLETTDNKLIIKIPNMLKIKDNHANNLQVTNKKVAPRYKNKNKIKNKIKNKNIYICKINEKIESYLLDKIKEFYINTLKPSEEIQEKWLSDNTVQEIIIELEKFKNYLEAKGRKYKSYSAAFSNWLKSDFRKREVPHGSGRRCEQKDYSEGAPEGFFK